MVATVAEGATSSADESAAPAGIEALIEYLNSDRAPPDSMMLADLDGFLTAIAIGPKVIAPSEWLPVVWGGEEPEFADYAEAQAVIGGILNLYNDILYQVREETFEPLVGVSAEGAAVADAWAGGFAAGMAMRGEAWQPLINSKRRAVLLFPILALCRDQDGRSPIGFDGASPEVDEQLSAAIPRAVLGIADYWSRRRPRGQGTVRVDVTRTAARIAAKPRRNELCSCGSGKKFKKCCGRAA